MRSAAVNQTLRNTISPERLKTYLDASNGILDAALSLYERNMRLSEAFYTPTQCLEVCLRNKLNLALTRTYGEDWFVNAGPNFQPNTQKKIQDAIDELRRSGCALTPGAVVAQLSFGFWVTILSRKYDASVWRLSLTNAFSQGGRRMSRQTVFGRMDTLRHFRNRLAHHEHIFRRPLDTVHSEIMEAIDWMCPETAAWAASHSRVQTVLAGD